MDAHELSREQLLAELQVLRGEVAAAKQLEQQHHQIEEALHQTRQTYRSLFESCREGIAYFGLDGRCLDANPVYLNMLDYTLEEMRQLNYQQVTPPRWTVRDVEGG